MKVKPSKVFLWEYGVNYPSLEELYRMMDALELEPTSETYWYLKNKVENRVPPHRLPYYVCYLCFFLICLAGSYSILDAAVPKIVYWHIWPDAVSFALEWVLGSAVFIAPPVIAWVLSDIVMTALEK